jgi:hypothetical protein
MARFFQWGIHTQYVYKPQGNGKACGAQTVRLYFIVLFGFRRLIEQQQEHKHRLSHSGDPCYCTQDWVIDLGLGEGLT